MQATKPSSIRKVHLRECRIYSSLHQVIYSITPCTSSLCIQCWTCACGREAVRHDSDRSVDRVVYSTVQSCRPSAGDAVMFEEESSWKAHSSLEWATESETRCSTSKSLPYHPCLLPFLPHQRPGAFHHHSVSSISLFTLLLAHRATARTASLLLFLPFFSPLKIGF